MKFRKYHEEAFTGLEAAIVLIAFVVVAAVFSYVVLGAGFFTTQKSQEVIHTGIQQASSTPQIVGNVYGQTETGEPAPVISWVIFSVALGPGGTPIDFDKVVITYSNATQVYTFDQGIRLDPQPGGGLCSIASVQNEVGIPNDILEPGEQFQIICDVDKNGDYTYGIHANDAFDIEIKPAVGSALDIHRTAPASIHEVNILY